MRKTIGYNFLPHDFLTILYFVFVILLVGFYPERVSDSYLHILIHSVAIVLIFLLAKWDKNNGFVSLIHYFYPILLFTFVYQETGRLNQIFHKGYFDYLLLEWDKCLFGNSPTFWLYKLIPNRIVSEYFHFSYTFYYLMVPLTFLYIYFRLKNNREKQRKYLLEYMFTLCFSFYIYYAIFILFPAVGGRTYVDIYARKGYFFKKIVDYIYQTQEINGGAFPSSHVGIAILCLMNLKKVGGGFYKIMLVLVPSLAVATVYCGYHYGVDLLAGIITGFLFYFIGRALYRKFFITLPDR